MPEPQRDDVALAEEVFSLGIATPLVASQLAIAVVRWTGRIFGWPMGLITSLPALRALLDVTTPRPWRCSRR